MNSSLEKTLLAIIQSKDFSEKVALALSLSHLPSATLHPLSPEILETLKTPGRPQDFKIVDPRNVPSRRNIQNIANRINFLHALANIELLAIELPCLCLLRFGSDDTDFVKMQLDVIRDEALHFRLLQDCLQSYDSSFGHLPVHHGLWDYAWQCQSLLEHQIMIPCYLEARGLDVTHEFVENFNTLGDFKSRDALNKIHEDEIKHVRYGIQYLEKVARHTKTSPEQLYHDTLHKFFGDKKKSRIKLNKESRSKAGFTQSYYDVIE